MNITLEKILKKFGSAYRTLSEEQGSLCLIQALHHVLSARFGKTQLSIAIADSQFMGLSEALADIGFVQLDSQHTFFGGDPDDELHPYNPLSNLNNYTFDVIFSKKTLLYHGPALVVDLGEFISATKQALKNIKRKNFMTCLNANKLGIVAAFVYLSPTDRHILEVGAYQCGTTLFVAELCKILGRTTQIFACDTFEGMPAATEQDKQDPIYYDTGMFTDNQIQKVKSRIKNQGLQNYITLVKGDVDITIPKLAQTGHLFGFVFLDTDQYKGTKAGLDSILAFQTAHILIDDTSLSSVSLAIDEFIEKNPIFTRKNLITNFDYVFSQ